MRTFHELLVSILGLLALSCVQSSTHSNKHPDVVSHSPTELALVAPHAEQTSDFGTAPVTPDFYIDAHARAPRIYIAVSVYESAPRLVFQFKRYRMFPTGLSPPSSAFRG